jgi:predicted RNA-binding protein with PIN domain
MSREHIVIDGYNVIFRTPRLRELVDTSLERARDELLRWLEEAYRLSEVRLTLVFDGERDLVHAGRRRRGTVRVLFSEPPESADDVIRQQVDDERRRQPGRKRLACRVVTSDADVAKHARLMGGKAIEVEGFLHELEEKRLRQRRLTSIDEPEERPATGRTRDQDPGPRPRDRTARPPSRRTRSPVEGSEAKPHVGGKRELDEWERLFKRERSDRDDTDDDDL